MYYNYINPNSIVGLNEIRGEGADPDYTAQTVRCGNKALTSSPRIEKLIRKSGFRRYSVIDHKGIKTYGIEKLRIRYTLVFGTVNIAAARENYDSTSLS